MIELLKLINWREPLWLLIALQPPLLILLTRLTKRIRHERFVQPQLLPWAILANNKFQSKHHGKNILLMMAWLAFAITMAGPRIAHKTISPDTSSYTNVMVIVDVSRSMSARDIQPSRLERAKLELYDFIERSQRSRIGIILYASKAHLLSPLTSDKAVLRHYLSTISTPLLPTRGSDLRNALQFAAQQLTDNTGPSQAILLVSDGENTHNTITPFDQTISMIKDKNISIYSLISGSENGAPILADESGWLRFNNEDVISKPQINLLQDIAHLTNGQYSHIENSDKDWQRLYDKGIAKLGFTNIKKSKESDLIIWQELYPWSLLVAVVFFVLAYLNSGFIRSNQQLAFVPLFFIGLAISPSQTQASETYQNAYRAYQQQNYLEAAEMFSQLIGYDARIGEASSAYQSKNYKKASSLFIQATLEAQTDNQRIHALFNLANSYYQLEQYQQAASIYQDVLRYQPDFKQAKINLVYANNLAKILQAGELPITTRGGKGPKIARLAPDADIGKGSLTLSDEADEKSAEIPEMPNGIPITDNDQVLLMAGLVTQEIETSDDVQWTYQITSPDALDSLVSGVESNETVFWQRLFEWEEGFPAPLSEPKNITGIRPW